MNKVIQIVSHEGNLTALDSNGDIWIRKQKKEGMQMYPKFKWVRVSLPKPKIKIPTVNYEVRKPASDDLICRDFGMIDSIKFIRSECNCGLKEAKDACEVGNFKQAREHLFKLGYYRG